MYKGFMTRSSDLKSQPIGNKKKDNEKIEIEINSIYYETLKKQLKETDKPMKENENNI